MLIFFVENVYSRGVNSGVTQFQMKFTLVSRHLYSFAKKTKKIVQEKLLSKYGLRF